MKHQVKRWIVNFGIVIAAAVFVLGACAQAAMPTPKSQDFERSVEGVAPAAPAMEAPAPSENQSGASQDVSNQAEDRLVIKNANMTIVVPDPSASMNRITSMAEEMGGFVVTANMYKQTLGNGIEVPRASITIRVPSEKLNQALDRIRGESDEDPENESISSQDVTSEYVDLQSRLKNLEAAEAELTAIMQDANRTEDVLAVYNRLVSIREQIEVIKGQIKYYEQSAALSAISVELIADQAIQPIEIGGWKPEGVVKDAIEALLKAMQGLISFLIWLVLFLVPILAVLVLIFVVPPVLIIRAWRKRRAKRKAAEAPQEPAP
jgi:hypothetical protein